jgi:hypothetical protein
MQVVHWQWVDAVFEGVDEGGDGEAPNTNIQAFTFAKVMADKPENNQTSIIKLQTAASFANRREFFNSKV